MPRLADHELRRREIAEAVWGVIAERGIEGVTLRAVAAEAGVSVGRIQHYYPSREELVRDSARVMLDIAEGVHGERTAEADPWEALQALVQRVIPRGEGFRLGTLVWTAYVAKSVDDAQIADLIAGAQQGAVDLAARLLDQARAAGQIADGEDSGVVALRLLAFADGCATRVLVGSLAAEDATEALQRELDRLRRA